MLQNHTEPAKLITLLELFDGRKFEVPDYQRGYSWELKHVNALLTDIERHKSGSGHKHFTGTIVVERTKGKNVYKIVDGQQRLATCIMILKAIVALHPETITDMDSIITKDGSNFNSALKLGQQDKSFFLDVILNFKRGVPIKTASNERLKGGYATIKTWLKDHKDKIAEIQYKLLNELGFIFFETISDKETNTMFEVINNRGKELSELEKIKNYYLHLANLYDFDEIRDKINSEWLGILANLEVAGKKSISQENHFLRNVFNIVVWKVDKKTEDLITKFKEYTEGFMNGSYDDQIPEGYSLKLEIVNSINFLVTSAKAYAFLFGEVKKGTEDRKESWIPQLNGILKKLRNHGTDRGYMKIYLSLMYLLFRYPQKSERIVECLNILEILNFRLFCLPRISNRETKKSENLDDYASDIFYGRILVENTILGKEYEASVIKDEYYFQIQEYLKSLIRDNCAEKDFLQNLTASHSTNYDSATWGSLKFFLAKYEHSLRDNDPNWDYETLCTNDENGNKLSTEHILAVRNLSIFEKEQHVEKRRLGNFILVEQDFNQKLSTKGVKDKVKFIDQHIPTNKRLKHVNELVSLYYQLVNGSMKDGNNTKAKQQRVVQKLFDLRETNMIKFALKEWAYPGEPEFKFEKVDTLEAERKKLNTRYFFRD